MTSPLSTDAASYWLGRYSQPKGKHHCPTRDIFQARLDTFLRTLLNQSKTPDEASLLVAIVGEAGNNCFDHNLGQWVDLPGCWFGYSLKSSFISVAVADRGRGILSSLKTVEPDLQDDQEAIELAFSKAVSGRFPERRGNGLKFVRRVINGHSKRGLFCQSGSGIMRLGALASGVEKELSINTGKDIARGVITSIHWGST